MGTVEEGLRSQIRNIEAAYGRPIGEWIELIRASGRSKHTEIVALLKNEHGMTHAAAHRVALVARDAIAGASGLRTPEELYEGRRSGLRPIHERLMAAVQAFGDDVESAPKKGYVSLRRRKQFAMIQPAASRVDVGLILVGAPATGRLEPAGSFNALFTHRVRVGSVEEVDQELLTWLRQAYDAAG